jgi:aryl-alcohol dehydrogenase-like predicted oxidoreductase
MEARGSRDQMVSQRSIRPGIKAYGRDNLLAKSDYMRNSAKSTYISVHRDIEAEIIAMCENQGMTIVPWAALSSG